MPYVGRIVSQWLEGRRSHATPIFTEQFDQLGEWRVGVHHNRVFPVMGTCLNCTMRASSEARLWDMCATEAPHGMWEVLPCRGMGANLHSAGHDHWSGKDTLLSIDAEFSASW